MMETKNKIRKTKAGPAFVFIVFIFIGGIVHIHMNGLAIVNQLIKSEMTSAYFSKGLFFRDTESAFSEQFPFRKELLGISESLNALKGISSRVEIVDTKSINVASDWAQEDKDPELIENTDFGSILIVDNRAVELNYYNKEAIHNYALAINSFSESVDETVNVYSLMPPTEIEFLDKDMGNISYSERDALNELKSQYIKTVQFVDVYDSIKAHRNEYIYFKTDHHWTQRGAYYAYCAFAKAKGFTPVSLEDLRKSVVEDFLGSLYRVTQSAKLEVNSDYIEVYFPNVDSRMYVDLEKSSEPAQVIDPNYVTEDNKYGVFFGGDKPFLLIESDCDGERSIAIVKDSYANAFIPFLMNHYRSIYVIDPRLWDGDLKALVAEQKIQDVLFLNYALINRYDSYSGILNKIMPRGTGESVHVRTQEDAEDAMQK